MIEMIQVHMVDKKTSLSTVAKQQIYNLWFLSVLSGVKRRSRRADSAVAFCHRTLCVQFKIIHAGTLSGEGKELWPCICANSLMRFLPKLKYFNDTFAVFWNSWPSICRQSERANFIFSFAYLQTYEVKRSPWSKSVGEGKIVRAIRPMTNGLRLQTWLVKMPKLQSLVFPKPHRLRLCDQMQLINLMGALTVV